MRSLLRWCGLAAMALSLCLPAEAQTLNGPEIVPTIVLTTAPLDTQTADTGDKYGDPPLNVNITHRIALYGGEAITPGFVWHTGKGEYGKVEWQQVPIGKCGFIDFCGKPMTFKKAAFDNHALLWLAVAAAGRIADTEYTFSLPCIVAHTCIEGNPILGSTRAQQYGVGFGMIIGIHFADAWLREGNLRTNEGGWRHWWVIPLEQVGFNTLGIVLNATNFKTK